MLHDFRESRRKSITDLYSKYHIPGRHLVLVGERVKVIIDPPSHYFGGPMRSDLRRYAKTLLIHGCEPPEINNIQDNLIEHGARFTKIYTFDPVVQAAVANSELFCFGSCWVTTDASGQLTELQVNYSNKFSTDKKFKVSFIRSSKQNLPGHQLRHDIGPLLDKQFNFEVYFPQQRIETKLPLFDDSMFHIAVENSRHPNYFTEKIIDCFMTYTVPIYWGSPNIGDYFNMRGVITFETTEDLERILNSLTAEDYHSRLEAVKANREIAKANYAFFFDRLNEYVRRL